LTPNFNPFLSQINYNGCGNGLRNLTTNC
jgi:hypothetical protein